MRVDLKILSLPLAALTLLLVLIYFTLSNIAIDFSNSADLEKQNIEQRANNLVNIEFNSNLLKVDHFAKTAALEQLVLTRNIDVISESLGSWKNLLQVSLFAFFDPESNTLHLPGAQSRPGDSFGLSDWLTEQLSSPQAQHIQSLVMFKGQPSLLNSSAINIAGETRGLFISGVKLDQQLVSKLASLTGYQIELTKTGGGIISSQELNSSLTQQTVTLKIPKTIVDAGYQLNLYYDSSTPYRKISHWPVWGLFISLLLVVVSLFWIWLNINQDQRQWQKVVVAAKSPKALRLISVSGLPRQLADNLAQSTDATNQLLESAQNTLSKVEYDKQLLTRKIKIIREENGRLQHAPNARSGFLSRMGDEITSPLKSVSSMLKLLAELKLAEEPKEIVEIARRSHQQLASNIDNVLDLSKLDARMLKLFPADFDIKVLVKELFSDLQPHALSKELVLEWNINERVPASCHGDRQRIHQVLYNLVGNAIRFTKQGSVGIYVDILYEKGSQFIRFTVKDTGIGIPKPALDAVFESFETHSRLTTSSFAGRLRLIVSKKLTRLMGGDIGVASEVGKGSRFWFTIKYQNPKGR